MKFHYFVSKLLVDDAKIFSRATSSKQPMWIPRNLEKKKKEKEKETADLGRNACVTRKLEIITSVSFVSEYF